jgi:nucleoid DNA-binding protein
MSVTKKDIVKDLAERYNLSQVDVRKVVQGTFDAIVDTLVRDSRIELRNFGVFKVITRKARKARNPRTGETVFVPEKRVVTFKPGREMEEAIQGGGEVAAGAEDAPSSEQV